MAAQKKSTGRATGSRTKSSSGVKEDQKKKSKRNSGEEFVVSFIDEIIALCVIGMAILILLSNFNAAGGAGRAISEFIFGLFGTMGYILPIYMTWLVFFLLANKQNMNLRVWRKIICSVCAFMVTASIFQLMVKAPESIGGLYSNASSHHNGGGFIGGILGYLLNDTLGIFGAGVILVVLAIIFGVLLTERSFVGFVRDRGDKVYQNVVTVHESRQEKRAAKKEQNEERSIVKAARRAEQNVIRMSDEDQSAMNRTRSTATDGSSYLKRVTIRNHSMSHNDKQSPEMEEIRIRNFQPIEEEITATVEKSSKNKVIDIFTQKPVEPAMAISSVKEDKPKPKIKPVSSILKKKEKTKQDDSHIHEIHPVALDRLRNEVVDEIEEYSMTKVFEGEIFEYSDGFITEEIRRDEVDMLFKKQKMNREEAMSGRKADFIEEEVQETSKSESDPETVEINEMSEAPTVSQRQEEFTGHDEYKEAHRHENPEMNTAPHEIFPVAPTADELVSQLAKVKEKTKYQFPPMDILAKPSRKQNEAYEIEIRQNALALKQTLESFGVKVILGDVTYGPAVTRYELQPDQGVRVNRIVALADDIKLNLAAADIRIEAPIPGTKAVGIEVPNKETSAVMLRELLEDKNFLGHPSKVAFAAGKNIGGEVVVADIAKMPHLLIAGSTGSGKSVCINTLIASILYKAAPSQVKLIMIDPKVVELSVYNGIPHLLIPVVTEPKKAASALSWAVGEMEERYAAFAEYNVRDLSGYNKKVQKDPDKEELPLIVIIVDELADLMMVASNEVEDSIVRLAQKARACGIHLVIATQRPSVNVITGLIKANIPSRIAFAVSSGTDSRTILDMNGAEKLLGKGDMLFYPVGMPKPVRVQGAFISDREVSELVDYLVQQNANQVTTAYGEAVAKKIAETSGAAENSQVTSDNDAYFVEAGKYIIENQKASIGMLQRVYKIGFNRAARIMDQLFYAGVVGPEEGTKPRKILMSMEDFEAYLGITQN